MQGPCSGPCRDQTAPFRSTGLRRKRRQCTKWWISDNCPWQRGFTNRPTSDSFSLVADCVGAECWSSNPRVPEDSTGRMRLVLHLTRRELPDNRMQLRRQQRLSRSSLCRRSRPFPPSKSIGHACGRILRTIRTFAVPVQSAAATRTTSCAVGASDASSPGSSWRPGMSRWRPLRSASTCCSSRTCWASSALGMWWHAQLNTRAG